VDIKCELSRIEDLLSSIQHLVVLVSKNRKAGGQNWSPAFLNSLKPASPRTSHLN
jgi:hypothetical protein